MNTIEINEPIEKKQKLTDDELFAANKSSPFINEKVEASKRIVTKLMEKYPDFEDRLSGKVPHP
jgi:hypothetical protein